MEIGSVYEINPDSVTGCMKNGTGDLTLHEVDKFGKQNTAFTGSGREAISLALRSIEKENPAVTKKCLMPAYMCDTVFFPFSQNGWELAFYHIGKDMKADEKQLRYLIETEKPGMLFIHAYYGTDTWKELRPVLREYQNGGLLLMEDMTQSYYLRTEYHADYLIGSLRKWYAVSDGGFVTTNHTLYPECVVKDDTFSCKRLKMQTDKWNYLKAMQTISQKTSNDSTDRKKELQEIKKKYLAQNRELEACLDRNEKITQLSELSAELLHSTKEEECKKKRNDNYRILCEGLQNKKTLTPIFQKPDSDAVPLYFPVYMSEREKLQEYLCKQDIYVPVLWPVGKENEEYLSEDEKYIFSHIAAIPMDQRYGRDEMNRIVAAVNEYEEMYR
ncbi:MAG: hypothetical protein ACI39N_03645 [Lachnospiraceae bacterium]